MFITKGTIYFLFFALSGIAGIVFIGFAMARSKKQKTPVNKWFLVFGIMLLIVSVFTGAEITIKTYAKIKTTIYALKNFPETVETESNKDTTDYVRILKAYEPLKYKGKVPETFYTEYGFYDWWRFPLVYPYSVNCTKVLDRGVIANDSGKVNFDKMESLNTVTPYFISFIFDKNYIAFINADAPDTSIDSGKYFIFNFQNGNLEKFNDRELLMKKLDDINFTGEREFISVRKYSQRF